MADLCNTFVLPASDVEIEIQLPHLCQICRLVNKFAAHFRYLAAQLDWGDSMLCTLFLEVLDSYICNKMVGKEYPHTLDAVVKLALDIDRRVIGDNSPPCHLPKPHQHLLPRHAELPSTAPYWDFASP